MRARLPAEAGFDSLSELANRCGIVAIQPAVDLVEALTNFAPKATWLRLQGRVEAMIDRDETLLELIEPLVDMHKMWSQEVDEFLILAVRQNTAS